MYSILLEEEEAILKRNFELENVKRNFEWENVKRNKVFGEMVREYNRERNTRSNKIFNKEMVKTIQ